MKLGNIVELLDAKVLCGDDMDMEIQTACGSDMMSDALAFIEDQAMLLTGLINPQSVRTAEMLDMRCICFVRGKMPGDDVVELARERGIAVLTNRYRMFSACGKLYQAGLRGGDC